MSAADLNDTIEELLRQSLLAWHVTGNVTREADGALLVTAGGKRLRISRAPADLPFIPVAVVDHTGESQAPNASCVEIPNEDEDCVDRELRVGKPEGRFVPGVNDCISFAGRTLNKCDLSPHPPLVRGRQSLRY